ncbi:ArnT family glycosyltransferase [Nocardia transvalensis]|uniref:ArnT family glycosyltransferase n=1 Tax=Nocardia transvalensis TaxID=37333 RepID=UPI0018944C01|nr:glycosyltransferase family 39 protein [Nocardia transvalensis]MBF6333061.1 glycosyltransferase family 39 protein [Nocardia transvalensis]
MSAGNRESPGKPRFLERKARTTALWTLLPATAVVYLWGLSRNGWANEYYAAAVQAGTQSWKALLFGSLDAGNAITVDKPPAALWVMALSGRLFGFGSWSMLLPEALMGVASVGLVYAAVRRWSGPAAGFLAGGVLALTPVAALMFRFNNPDALLVLLLVVAAYCTVRATENGSGRWLALAGVAVGFGFLTKMMQALLVLPAFGLVFLIAAPIGWRQRIGKLIGAGAALIVSAGWYVALIALWPSTSRPYIGGSTDNSLLQLALGYNGLNRVLGGSGKRSGGAAFGGASGPTRLFGDSMGTEISWLLPAALIGLAAGLWIARRTPRTGRTRAALILWGGWLVVTGLVFSYMQGIMHPYYTVALAPAIAALIGISAVELWRGRAHFAARGVLGAMVATTGVWNFVLLQRTPDWYPALRWVVLAGSIMVAVILLLGAHRLRRSAFAVTAAALLVGLAGTTAYTLETVATSHDGTLPISGPRTGRDMGGPGIVVHPDGAPGASAPGDGSPTAPEGYAPPPGHGGFDGPSVGTNTELQNLLKNAGNRWAAATVGAHSAASLELSTGTSIMAIGGFSGRDDFPTLTQFQQYVAAGEIHYFLPGDGPHRGSGPGTEITAWVRSHFRSHTVGGTTVYDLTEPLTQGQG